MQGTLSRLWSTPNLKTARKRYLFNCPLCTKKKKKTEIPRVVKYYKETKRNNNNLTQEKLWYMKNFFDAATLVLLFSNILGTNF